MSIVRLHQVSKTYYNGKVYYQALQDVSLQIDAGEFVVLVGPSGSGKTTLLNIIGCLDWPSSGDVYLNEQPIRDLSEKELAAERNLNLGFIFQNFNLISALNALENIEFPLLIRKTAGPERKAKSEYWLKAVGLEEFDNHRPNELSGGQQQRVAVARALAGEPKLVLADEPTANLDSQTGAAIVQLMKDLNRERGVTLLLSTHDERIIRFATRIVHLMDGKIIAS